MNVKHITFADLPEFTRKRIIAGRKGKPELIDVQFTSMRPYRIGDLPQYMDALLIECSDEKEAHAVETWVRRAAHRQMCRVYVSRDPSISENVQVVRLT